MAKLAELFLFAFNILVGISVPSGIVYVILWDTEGRLRTLAELWRLANTPLYERDARVPGDW